MKQQIKALSNYSIVKRRPELYACMHTNQCETGVNYTFPYKLQTSFSLISKRQCIKRIASVAARLKVLSDYNYCYNNKAYIYIYYMSGQITLLYCITYIYIYISGQITVLYCITYIYIYIYIYQAKLLYYIVLRMYIYICT
jgi:hypothetical protein